MERTTRRYPNMEAFQQDLPAMHAEGWTVRHSHVTPRHLPPVLPGGTGNPMDAASAGAIGPGVAQFPGGSGLLGLIVAPVYLASALVSGIAGLAGFRKKADVDAEEVVEVVYQRPPGSSPR